MPTAPRFRPPAAASAASAAPSRPAPWWRRALRLLASMRFAIAIMLVLCLGALAASLVPQQQTAASYYARFGPTGGAVILALGLDDAYGAWWFLALLGFLIASTSLCVARHAPYYLAGMRRLPVHIRINGFAALPWRARATLAGDAPALAAQAVQALRQRRWRATTLPRHDAHGAPGWLVAARKGASRKWGYIASHSAIALIGLGGLIDSGLWVQWQRWRQDLQPWAQAGAPDSANAAHWLSPRTPAYRGELHVAEGRQSATALIASPPGALALALPFALGLERFEVTYHPNGAPQRFASQVAITDRHSGQLSRHRIEVNHPLRVHGVDVYLAGFGDGGSPVTLRPVALRPAPQRPASSPTAHPPALHTRIGQALPVGPAQGLPQTYTLEAAQLGLFHIEDGRSARQAPPAQAEADAATTAAPPAAAPASIWRERLRAASHAGHAPGAEPPWRDFGPHITYRLRDASGQAHAFRHFQRAADLGDGVPVFLLGVREPLAPEADWRYLRIPQDAQGRMDDFLRLSHALGDARARQQAVQRYVQTAALSAPAAAALHASASQALAAFAGARTSDAHTAAAQPPDTQSNTSRDSPPADATHWPNGGLPALARLLEQTPPEHAQHSAALLLRMLQGLLLELLQARRHAEGLPALDQHAPATHAFLHTALTALDALHAYPVPVAFTLEDFTPVYQAAFQITRAPGQPLVFAGLALLVLGVGLMLYVREQRLWLWLRQRPDSATCDALLGMNSPHRTQDMQRRF
ncbi:MAG: cytochrome c biogenesis protein ResB, partial [Comamonadaceae bacterium]|nr:cytochrome c biogenesis protein ResB [Comamonadaceae bacterium]